MNNTKCPRCQKEFSCNVSEIKKCFCSSIKLTKAQSEKIKKTYKDCLCEKCLKEIRTSRL
ncbi:MAG: cysteine-rich CWC family protein [Bacteroidota bacterium]